MLKEVKLQWEEANGTKHVFDGFARKIRMIEYKTFSRRGVLFAGLQGVFKVGEVLGRFDVFSGVKHLAQSCLFITLLNLKRT